MFSVGDILVVRTGWLGWHDQADEETRIRLTKDKHESVGVAASEETAAWIWYVLGSAVGVNFPISCSSSGRTNQIYFARDHRFAGVAADNPTFESWPPNGSSPACEFLS